MSLARQNEDVYDPYDVSDEADPFDRIAGLEEDEDDGRLRYQG
jgi:hypothetical protein